MNINNDVDMLLSLNQGELADFKECQRECYRRALVRVLSLLKAETTKEKETTE
jgi:hypothetical protein